MRSHEGGRGIPPHIAPVDALDETAAQFQAMRPRLFGIAYRVTGSAAEAEDVVQDVWLKWQDYDRDSVEQPEAFLVTTTTRTAINVLNSARVRREAYVGPWLPEPIDTASSPELEAEHNESLSLAVLLLLESLSPSERTAFVLREAFGYQYSDIAEMLGATQTAVRKLVSRARRHLADGRRVPASPSQHQRLLSSFLAAARSGDVDELHRVLAADVVSLTDGGGEVAQAARIAVTGQDRVAKFVAAFSTWFWDTVEVRFAELNGEAALVMVADGATVATLSIRATDEGIDRLLWVMNPQKLSRV